jgi:predicted PurR-regulated permease PerM
MRWKDKINQKYTQISIYVIFTCLIIYILGVIITKMPEITHEVIEKLTWVMAVIKPVIIGFAFAYILNPVVDFFEKRYQKLKEVKLFGGIVAPRSWAVLTAVFVLLVVVAGIISVLVYTVTDQIRLANFDDLSNLAQIYGNSFNSFIKSIGELLDKMNLESQQFKKYVDELTNAIGAGLMSFVDSTVNSVKNISGQVTTIVFALIIAFYFLLDGKIFTNFLNKFMRAMFSDKFNAKVKRTLNDLDEVFSGYIRGQLTDALVMAFLISITLTIVGVKFAIIIGILAGIGNLIPYVGPVVAYITASLSCLVTGDMKTWIVAMIALFAIQFIDGNIIGPKLLSNSIQIHPLVVIVSLIVGSAIGGLLGMLLAVPVGAFIKLIFVRFVDQRLEHKEQEQKEQVGKTQNKKA